MITSEIAITISFIIFISLAFMPTTKFFLKIINNKITQIYKDIDESIKIRQDAESQLAQAIQENVLIDKKCEEILILTKKQVDSLKANAEKQLIALAKKRRESVKQALSYQSQIETSKLRHYLLKHTFTEIENTLQAYDCKYVIKNKKLNLYKLVNNSIH